MYFAANPVHLACLFFFKVAGGEGISVMLNKWSPDDKLLYISDKTNWWNLYRLDGETETNLYPREQEIGAPAWEFGGSPYSCNPTGNGDILIAQEEVQLLYILIRL